MVRAPRLRHDGGSRDAGASAFTREETTMKPAVLCTVLLLLACALPVQAADKHEMTYKVGANVDVQGRVTVTQLDADVPASIAPVLAAAVKQWQFVPATNHGHPVLAHTFIFAKLQATPNAAGRYDVRISFAGNGPKLQTLNAQPHYPEDAIHARQSAFLILNATVQPDGSLTDMTVSSKFEGWHPLPSFKNAVLAVAKRWHAIPEQVDDQPVATRMRIPVSFTLNPPQFTMKQIRMLREAVRQDAATEAQPGIPLPSEQELALDSPLRPSTVATITTAP